jgi:predicted dehydrogenase
MIKIGLIGFGTMGKNYARILKKLNNENLCVFSSISDLNPSLKFEAEKYAKFYQDYKEMIEKEDLNAVCIVTPAQQNAKVAKQCIQMGISNILIEKPIVPLAYLREGYELLNLAKEKNARVMSADIICYDPATITLKKNLNKLGKIKAILTIRFGKYPYRFTDVGVNEDLLVHDLTFARYLLEWEKFYVKSVIKHPFFRETQIDFVSIEAISQSNVKLIASATWLSEEKIRLAIVIGEEKIAQINFLDEKKSLRFLPKEMIKQVNFEVIKKIEEKEIGEAIPLEKYEPLEKELRYFLETIKNNETPITNLERALETLEMLYPTIL